MPASLRVIVVLSLSLCGGTGCATVGKNYGGIPNFATVDPAPQAIYRGGQPSKAGFATLKDLGVKTVVDLRDDPVPWERQVVTEAGMTYVNLPSNAARTSPTVIASFLSTLKTAERPVYIHCRRGRDRTGLEIACYRLVHQQDAWTRADVLRELREHGYQRFFFPGIERYLRTMDPQDFMSVPVPDATPDAAIAGG